MGQREYKELYVVQILSSSPSSVWFLNCGKVKSLLCYKLGWQGFWKKRGSYRSLYEGSHGGWLPCSSSLIVCVAAGGRWEDVGNTCARPIPLFCPCLWRCGSSAARPFALCFQVARVNIAVHFTAWTWNKHAPGWFTLTLAKAANVMMKATSPWRLLCVPVPAWWPCFALCAARAFISLVFGLWSLDCTQSEAPAVQAAPLQLTPASWPRLKGLAALVSLSLWAHTSHSHPAQGGVSGYCGWVRAMHSPEVDVWAWSSANLFSPVPAQQLKKHETSLKQIHWRQNRLLSLSLSVLPSVSFAVSHTELHEVTLKSCCRNCETIAV